MSYVSGGAAPNNAYDIYVYGQATYCVVPLNDSDWEQPEDVVATLYFDMLSGGSDVDPPPVAYDSFTATIIDDDATFSVYWREANPPSGAALSGNPNGGGARFFPEQTDPNNANSLKNNVDLFFKLNASSDEDITIYYRLLDPDNNISLGYNQPTDSIFAGNDNNNRAGFKELPYNQTRSVVIPSGATEYYLTLELSNAYAGDNFIVVAGRDQATVASAELGTTATERYEVVQPIGATDETKLRQTQNLTVWRTLWVEYDYMTLDGRDVDAPTLPTHIQNQLANACIKVKAYSPNETPSVAGVEVLPLPWDSPSDGNLDGYVEPYAVACRNIASPSSNLWTLHIIDAFACVNPADYGCHYGGGTNTAFIFNQTIEQDEASNNWETVKTTVLLHEIGHALSLEDYDVETPKTAIYQKTIMDFPSVDPSVLGVFTPELLRIIQSTVAPL